MINSKKEVLLMAIMPSLFLSGHEMHDVFNANNIQRYLLLPFDLLHTDEINYYDECDIAQYFAKAGAINAYTMYVNHDKNDNYKKSRHFGGKFFRFAQRKLTKAIGREVERFLSDNAKRKTSGKCKKSFYICLNYIDF